MSIRIVPQDQLIESIKHVGGVEETPLLFYPNLDALYADRAKRFNTLAIDHPFGDYLGFSAQLADALAKTHACFPLDKDLADVVKHAELEDLLPLDCRTLARDPLWREMFASLIDTLLANEALNETIRHTLTTLKSMPSDELERLATALLTQDLSTISSDKALFIWAALSLYWAKMAQQLSKVSMAKVETGEHRQFCPICHSAPVASVVHVGAQAGTRYLHCSLCETEWYLPRAKCTNCEEMAELTYLSLDDENAPIKAECCQQCHSYLKVIYQEKLPNLDVIADDLAALILAAKVEEEGFSCSGINPYLFPGNDG